MCSQQGDTMTWIYSSLICTVLLMGVVIGVSGDGHASISCIPQLEECMRMINVAGVPRETLDKYGECVAEVSCEVSDVVGQQTQRQMVEELAVMLENYEEHSYDMVRANGTTPTSVHCIALFVVIVTGLILRKEIL